MRAQELSGIGGPLESDPYIWPVEDEVLEAMDGCGMLHQEQIDKVAKVLREELIVSEKRQQDSISEHESLTQ